ncbi:unnamed protein product [Cylicocyclus nassatus]|uniref:Uncharacterized protein n=1 Tax=Cylicocyclus nassatus TaxID=53992 RepID=A0AA36GWI9_CYLNA|nr:unnamed protein product [Cylicocyclus nassatus]
MNVESIRAKSIAEPRATLAMTQKAKGSGIDRIFSDKRRQDEESTKLTSFMVSKRARTAGEGDILATAFNFRSLTGPLDWITSNDECYKAKRSVSFKSAGRSSPPPRGAAAERQQRPMVVYSPSAHTQTTTWAPRSSPYEQIFRTLVSAAQLWMNAKFSTEPSIEERKRKPSDALNSITWFDKRRHLGTIKRGDLRDYCGAIIAVYWIEFIPQQFAHLSAPSCYQLFKGRPLNREYLFLIYFIENDSKVSLLVNAHDQSGFSPLKLTLSSGHINTANQLLSKNASCNAVHEAGKFIVVRMIEKGREYSSMQISSICGSKSSMKSRDRIYFTSNSLTSRISSRNLILANTLIVSGADLINSDVDGCNYRCSCFC